MKHNILRTVLLVALSLGLAATASAQGHHPCSVAHVAGDWGYSLQGTFFPPTAPSGLPVAFVGTLNVDDSGFISGAQTSNVNGVVTHDVLKGSLTVNPDCTGRQTIEIYNQDGVLLRTAVWALVYLDDETESRGTFESLTSATGMNVPAVAVANGKRLFKKHAQQK